MISKIKRNPNLVVTNPYSIDVVIFTNANFSLIFRLNGFIVINTVLQLDERFYDGFYENF